MPRPRITLELLHRLKSPKGGYTREALAILEIPWPPKKGWRRKLMIEAKENFARDELEKEQAKRQVTASNTIMNECDLKPGLKFKIKDSDMTVEILDKPLKDIGVRITSPSSGTWTETWVLSHTLAGFNHFHVYETL